MYIIIINMIKYLTSFENTPITPDSIQEIVIKNPIIAKDLFLYF